MMSMTIRPCQELSSCWTVNLLSSAIMYQMGHSRQAFPKLLTTAQTEPAAESEETEPSVEIEAEPSVEDETESSEETETPTEPPAETEASEEAEGQPETGDGQASVSGAGSFAASGIHKITLRNWDKSGNVASKSVLIKTEDVETVFADMKEHWSYDYVNFMNALGSRQWHGNRKRAHI